MLACLMGPGFTGSFFTWQTPHWPAWNGAMTAFASAAGQGLRAAPRRVGVRFSSVRRAAAAAFPGEPRG